jgi:ParB family chromosome partitioning protein
MDGIGVDFIGVNGEVVVEGSLRRVPITRITTSRWQPREPIFDGDALWELAKSIKEQGLINPIVVFQSGETEFGDPLYELVAGERRTRAVMGIVWAAWDDDQTSEKDAVMRLAAEGLEAVPMPALMQIHEAGVTILARVESGEDLSRLHQLAVIENIERQGLTPLEEARALHGLQQELELSQRDLAARIGKSQSYVAQRLSLLGLAEEAQEGVSTRVLSATHARAIARVPKELQPDFVEWTTNAISRSDSPATTRQVQNRARELAAFVDPDRWLPNGERVYKPQDRNRLALIRTLLTCGGVDVAEHGKDLLGLIAVGWGDHNILAKSPIKVVQTYNFMQAVLEALGYSGHTQTVWDDTAPMMGRTCSECLFYGVDVDYEIPSQWEPHCNRMKGHDTLATCQNFIGVEDPVAIPLEVFDVRWYKKAGVDVVEDPFPHMSSVSAYVNGLQLAIEQKKQAEEEEDRRKAQKHLEPMKMYVDWVTNRPKEDLRHFQAHSCFKCVHYVASLGEDPEAIPCRFALDPLTDHRGGSRAPKYGVLVMRDGTVLPRCEMFSYRNMPFIAREVGVELPVDRRMVVEWLHALATTGHYATDDHNVIWGVLRWLNYGRSGKGNDYDKLKRYLIDKWDDLGGDGAICTLLNVVLSEGRLRNGRATMPATLFNAATNNPEEFAFIGFDEAIGEKPVWSWVADRWPDDWPRPWEDHSVED